MKKICKLLLITLLFLFIPCISSARDKETYISKTAYKACIEYGEKYGICPELIMAIIERESSGKAHAENGSCKGLMQVSYKWHKERMDKLGVKSLFDEKGNILVGTDYLAELFERYEDTEIVLAVYHGEKDATKKKKPSGYVKGILKRSRELERLHGK